MTAQTPATAEALAAHGLELLRVPSPWETGDADPDAPPGPRPRHSQCPDHRDRTHPPIRRHTEESH